MRNWYHSGSYDRFYSGVAVPVIQHGSKDKVVSIGEAVAIPFISFFLYYPLGRSDLLSLKRYEN